MNFLDRSSKNAEIAKLMKIRLVEADVSHMDGQTDRHHEANGRFSKFANATKYTHITNNTHFISSYNIIKTLSIA
jgi:hypothetical protein